MRLATIEIDGRTAAIRIDADTMVELPFADVGELLLTPEWRTQAAGEGTRIDPASVTYKALIPHPNKIVCLGLN